MTYLELKALPDDQLAAHGFVRNESGGLTRLPGAVRKAHEERKKTWGIASLAKAMLSGNATPALQYARLRICDACNAKDDKGDRLYRVIDGRAYCGVPRLSDVTKIRRDETKEGCGCQLILKASKNDSECPLGKWPNRATFKAEDLKQEKVPIVKLVITRRPCGCRKTKNP